MAVETKRDKYSTVVGNFHLTIEHLLQNCPVTQFAGSLTQLAYINFKTKKPLIGYQDGARHTKSKV